MRILKDERKDRIKEMKQFEGDWRHQDSSSSDSEDEIERKSFAVKLLN